MKTYNLFTLPSKPLFGYVMLCLAPLITLLVAGAVAGCSMLGHVYHGISQYLLFNECIDILGKGWNAGPFCLVFCSTLAALVSVIPVLCSLILRS